MCRAPGAIAAYTIFTVYSMTRLGIKPQSTGYQVDALNRYTKRRLNYYDQKIDQKFDDDGKTRGSLAHEQRTFELANYASTFIALITAQRTAKRRQILV